MTEAQQPRQPWSAEEVDLIIADYFNMRQMELSGKPYVKSERNQELRTLIKRSRGSIEFKHQNISAVLELLGEPWIAGYKPRFNFQKSLIDGIERYLEQQLNPVPVAAIQRDFLTDYDSALFIEAAPTKEEEAGVIPPALSRLIRKFDPAKRDEHNRALGKAGEERVLRYEHWRLRQAGMEDLAKQIRWVSQEDGDGAGYDIHSFTDTGEDRLLEVKTTMGHRKTPFYLTRNEKLIAEERGDALRIFRLYNFASQPKAFEMAPPLEDQLYLNPTNYEATFR